MTGETWHDQRPTHKPKPQWLIDAEQASQSAWKAHAEAIDDYLDTDGNDREAAEAAMTRMYAALTAAKAAQDWTSDCRWHWQNGKVPASILAAQS